MSEALPACPSGKKGAHDIHAVLPDSDGKPILLFCNRCGTTTHQTMDLPKPLDDLPGDAIAELSRRKR